MSKHDSKKCYPYNYSITGMPSDTEDCVATPLHNTTLSCFRKGGVGPEAVLDAVKDSAHPHTTCSALSLCCKREDNVLSHPPTRTTLYLSLFVKCLLQHNSKRASLLVCVGKYNDHHNEYHRQGHKYTLLLFEYHHSLLICSILGWKSLESQLDPYFLSFYLSLWLSPSLFVTSIILVTNILYTSERVQKNMAWVRKRGRIHKEEEGAGNKTERKKQTRVKNMAGNGILIPTVWVNPCKLWHPLLYLGMPYGKKVRMQQKTRIWSDRALTTAAMSASLKALHI